MLRLSRIGMIAAVGALAVVTCRAEADPTDPFQSAPIARPTPKPIPRPPRAEPEPAIAVSPPAAPAPPRSPDNYNGSYAGAIRLQAGQSESTRLGAVGRGGGSASYENCNSASIPQSIEISGGSFRFLFNQQDNIVINGRVDGSGVLSGFGNSPFGGAKLSAQILNGVLSGTIVSSSCNFTLDLRRR
jgi:hypothetical protein